MSGKWPAYITAISLALLGLLFIFWRQVDFFTGPSPDPVGKIWRLSYIVHLSRVPSQATYRVALPRHGRRNRIVKEYFSHPGFSLDFFRHNGRHDRYAGGVAFKDLQKTELRFDFDIHVIPTLRKKKKKPSRPLTVDERAQCLQENRLVQVSAPEVEALANRLALRAASVKAFSQAAFRYCFQTVKLDRTVRYHDALKTLQNKRGSPAGKRHLMLALCRSRNIPARLVTGFFLRQTLSARPYLWSEVQTGKNMWTPYDVVSGFALRLPANVLPVVSGGRKVVRMTKGRAQVQYTVRRMPGSPDRVRLTGKEWISCLDLKRLPIAFQEILIILLLLPFGALVTVCFRNVIGLQTIGTFTPALLALSFIYADWRAGLIMFALMLAVGLTARSLLQRMKLMLVPRLSALLTLVVLVSALAVSVLYHYNLTSTAKTVLLPIVIMTMIIERFHIITEEESVRSAAGRLTNTVLVALACYGLLNWKSLGWTILRYPESLLLVTAALIGLGKYSGYRLVELWRFRGLGDIDERYPAVRKWFSLPRLWADPRVLHRRGVLGMNARNLDYIFECNAREDYPQVDNKLKTKQYCEARGIPVPITMGVVGRYGDIAKVIDQLSGWDEFVIKPAEGCGGNGIMVITGRRGERFIGTSRIYTRQDIYQHISSILSGLYSLGGRLDTAILEQRVRPHPMFTEISGKGTPDIRIIVYKYTARMAMLRLPTAASQGRANLHQGAVGVGIDMESGVTYRAIQYTRLVEVHPDSHRVLNGITLPQWRAVVDYAEELSRHLCLGYVGIDLVLDEHAGPLILEANARPGLAIQLANHAGLISRL